MKLAKPHLDLGLFTADLPSQLTFWSETVGLRFDHAVTVKAGWTQHRYDAHGSVIKVNHRTDPLPPWAASGYTMLAIARDGPVWEGRHPGGDRVRLVPPGTDGVVGIAVTVETREPARMLDFYFDVMEFDEVGSDTARCGDTLLFVERGRGGVATPDFIAANFRYLTIQIFNADEICAGIVARGGRLARAPVTLGTVARIGFVTDPDGNWIEVSERASVTGIAPPSARNLERTPRGR